MSKFKSWTEFLSSKFILSIGSLVILNCLLYLFINSFYQLIPFNQSAYLKTHRYLEDPRIVGQNFQLLRSLTKHDSQWYLKIADSGYPSQPTDFSFQDTTILDGLSYAYFPLYPFLLHFINKIFGNLELTALIFSNLVCLFILASLYFVVSQLKSTKVAFKTIYLIFLFPFSVFFRLYYPEGLFLLLLIWFSYFLIKKNFLVSAVFLGLVNVTRGNAVLLNIMFAYLLFREIKAGRQSIIKSVGPVLLWISPQLIKLVYDYFQTGDPFFSYYVASLWFPPHFWPIQNLKTILEFTSQELHFRGSSQIEIITFLIITVLILKSKQVLNPIWWGICLSLWITPLLIKDLSGYTRYQIVSFPLFVYLAETLPNKYYYLILGLFSIGLFAALLLFVNGYWVD